MAEILFWFLVDSRTATHYIVFSGLAPVHIPVPTLESLYMTEPSMNSLAKLPFMADSIFLQTLSANRQFCHANMHPLGNCVDCHP
jgi:hypothetical protein